ncbi:actin binding protein [Cymbomonas tetramitiformis]|uniref:Actin binding protein n=1 Tax=Cymbomonas tetramitiformis TaxID=36881 RepID=A0AAE0FIT6_9CHLO|nr:actin binding protein [Cymbomonas tetramitiformis]
MFRAAARSTGGATWAPTSDALCDSAECCSSARPPLPCGGGWAIPAQLANTGGDLLQVMVIISRPPIEVYVYPDWATPDSEAALHSPYAWDATCPQDAPAFEGERGARSEPKDPRAVLKAAEEMLRKDTKPEVIRRSVFDQETVSEEEMAEKVGGTGAVRGGQEGMIAGEGDPQTTQAALDGRNAAQRIIEETRTEAASRSMAARAQSQSAEEPNAQWAEALKVLEEARQGASRARSTWHTGSRTSGDPNKEGFERQGGLSGSRRGPGHRDQVIWEAEESFMTAIKARRTAYDAAIQSLDDSGKEPEGTPEKGAAESTGMLSSPGPDEVADADTATESRGSAAGTSDPDGPYIVDYDESSAEL